MAVTRKPEQAYQPSQQVQQAQTALQQTTAQKPAAYKPAQQVQQAQQAMQQNQAAKPQGYTSKYGPQLDNILQQIQNPQDFKYEFNGDELFKYYADNYTQKGKQAAANVMGQAAALTGGYGNSYGQQIANQTYDQYLLDLYDKGMDLRDRAYQQYADRRADQYNQYNVLAGADDRDYGRYRDTVGDWERERDYLTGRYDTERGFDYGQYQDQLAAWQADRDYAANRYDTERNFDYGAYMDAAQRAEQQYQFDAQMAENIRQFDANLDWDKMSAQQKYAAEYAMSILQMGQMPSAELLQQAGLSAEDAKKLMAQISKGGGGNAGVVYLGPDGKYYQKGKTGLYEQIDRDKVNPNATIDDSKVMNIAVQPVGISAASAVASGIGSLVQQDEKKKK